MADDKWIPGLRSDMPVAAAAQKALALRLGVVRDRLPAAVFHVDADVENVHQLRVGTRRAAAALRIFAGCLPRRLYEKTRKILRAVRRAAGAARDWDVFLAMIEPRLSRSRVPERHGMVFLVGYAHGQRDLAQERLTDAYHDHADLFANGIDKISQSLEKARDSDKTLRDLAADTLNELLREFETAAQADLQSYAALHQVRILGKQLRYAMEAFESCYTSELRQKCYPAVVEMQDILGLANDSHTIVERLTALRAHLLAVSPRQWARCQAGIETLMKFHERRLPVQRRKFEKWWRAWLKSGFTFSARETPRERST